MSNDSAIRQLKEIAKWSHDPEQKKTAIRELTAHGQNALAALQEILNVTAYDEIKAACIDAIKSAKEKESTTAGVSSSVSVGNKKNEEQEKDENKGRVALADLPP